MEFRKSAPSHDQGTLPKERWMQTSRQALDPAPTATAISAPSNFARTRSASRPIMALLCGLLMLPLARAVLASPAALQVNKGYSSGKRIGAAVCGLGDLNGDGYDDFAVGLPYEHGENGGGPDGDPGTRWEGRVRIYSGADYALLMELKSPAKAARFGYSINSAGDVNMDGYLDLIVGAPYDSSSVELGGRAFVFSGQEGAVLYTLSGPEEGELFGTCVDGAGDVDGDGYDDLIIGAPLNSVAHEGSGRAYVISGKTGASLHLFDGDAVGDRLGFSVAGASDVDNDGYDDLIVGAPQPIRSGSFVGAGYARVYSGMDGSTLHTLTGTDGGDQFGCSVDGGEDLDLDGYDDLIVGAKLEDIDANPLNGDGYGSVRAFSGFDGSQLFGLFGSSAGDLLGQSVSGAGDVNMDGYPDFIAGASQPSFTNTSNAPGYIRVYSGLNGSSLHSVPGNSASLAFGWAVAGAGDVNGDGYCDVIVGDPLYLKDGAVGGRVRVLSGASGSSLVLIDE